MTDTDNRDFFEEELLEPIELTDEEGNTALFEFLDLMEYEGEEYAFLMPADDEEATELVVLKVVATEGDTEEYCSVDDEELLNTLVELFRERLLKTLESLGDME